MICCPAGGGGPKWQMLLRTDVNTSDEVEGDKKVHHHKTD